MIPAILIGMLLGIFDVSFLLRNAEAGIYERFPELAPELAYEGLDSRPVDSFPADQPPILCGEKLIPTRAPEPCPDFSTVINPWKDWPTHYTEKDKNYWMSNYKAGIYLCRADEVVRREQQSPGHQPASWLELASMRHRAEKTAQETSQAIRSTSFANDIPYPILYGALTQESLLANLGLNEDGGNFSCGIGQLNLREWCQYAQTLSDEEKTEIQWDPSVTECDSKWLSTELLRPYLQIAIKRMGQTPLYEMESRHLAGITYNEIAPSWTVESPEIQTKRFAATRSFAEHCMQPRSSIMAKSNALKNLFYGILPSAAWTAQQYAFGKSFEKNCREPYGSSFYPLHSGWLVAVAAYNAGGTVATGLLQHYYQLTPQRWQSPGFWSTLTPQQLVEAYYWGGKTFGNQVRFTGVNGIQSQTSWFKSCVLQRHAARVAQNVSEFDKILTASFDAPEGCTPHSPPPARRDSTSGVKPLFDFDEL